MSAAARGRGGAIAAGHAVPVETGSAVLRAGGNAVDAIVAAAFAAFVVEPVMCGVGGHGRLSVHVAATGETWGVDHFLVAPAAATPTAFARALAAGADAERGPLSVGVPGAIAGLCEAARRFASRELPRLMAPAIAPAEAGIPVDARTAALATTHARTIARFPVLARWLAGGDRLDGRDLARTLAAIAEGGAAAVHTGGIAEAIARATAGGFLAADDLAGYAPRVGRQTLARFRDLRYATCGDLIAVETLNILEQLAPTAPPDDRTAWHLLAEAMAQAFVDSAVYGGDEANSDLPLAGLASREYAKAIAATIRPDRARHRIEPGEPWRFGPTAGTARAFRGTTQICTADRDGNIASLITSIDGAFGSMILVPGTGILLGNGLQLFALFEGGLNPIAPGRMPLYGAPAMVVLDESGGRGAFAGAGGYRIASGVLATLVNIVDRGMALEDAIEHPRLHSDRDGIEVDPAMPAGVREGLASLGHRLAVAETGPFSWPFGRTSALWRHRDGLWAAASGPRCGAAAALAQTDTAAVRQSSRMNVISMVTRYSAMAPFATLAFISITCRPVMPRIVLLARFRPDLTASSKLLGEDAVILVTLATAMTPLLDSRISRPPC